MLFSLAALLLLPLFATSVEAQKHPKALLIVPGISRSQLIFSEAVTKELAKNGFEVTQFIMATVPQARSYKAPAGTKAIIVDADPERFYEKMEQKQNEMVFKGGTMTLDMARGLMEFLAKMTENVAKQTDVIAKLKAEKFDIGYGNMYSFGSTGLLEAIGIKSTVFLPSGNLIDHMYWFIGCPVPWSYVPNVLMPFSDKMTFKQRFINAVANTGFLAMQHKFLLPKEQAIMEKYFGPNFPKLETLVSNYQLVMLNSEEFLDLPRPTLHKIIYIAGIGMAAKSIKPVPADFDAMLNKGKKGAVIFSLGTVAKSGSMPDRLRKALFNAFRKLPEYHFIVRFEGNAPEADGADNIDIVKWLPQKELLNDKRIKLFITHGGYNSVLETVRAGVPMVLMPLFGDQLGNGIRAERAGVGLSVDKLTLTEEKMLDTMATILRDDGYRQRAEKLARMIAKKPEQPEDRLVKWSKFLVEFKTLENLRPASADLTFIEYFNLDAAAIVAAVLFVVLLISKKVLCFLVRKCCSRKSVPAAKKKQ